MAGSDQKTRGVVFSFSSASVTSDRETTDEIMKIYVILILGILTLAKSEPHTLTQEHGSESKANEAKTNSEQLTSKSSTKHDQESGKHGSDLSELHRVEDLDKGGKKHKHFHADKHETFHKSGAESAHGAKFEEASKRHKGNYKKGYLEKFHKDELMKHDRFFNKGEKSGSYNIFGKKGAKYGSEAVSKHSGGAFKSLKSEGKHGKGSRKAGGHNKSEKKGRKSSKSTKSNYSNGEKSGKKGGKKGGKQFQANSKQ